VDAVAPALIGFGLWLCYEAWTNPNAAPIAKVKAALGSGTTSGGGAVATPNPTTGVVGQVLVNPNTGVAIVPGLGAKAQ
jgi:hypothetical protein